MELRTGATEAKRASTIGRKCFDLRSSRTARSTRTCAHDHDAYTYMHKPTRMKPFSLSLCLSVCLSLSLSLSLTHTHIITHTHTHTDCAVGDRGIRGAG